MRSVPRSSRRQERTAPTLISPIVQKVDDRQEDGKKIEEVTGALKFVLTVITVLLICASLLLIGNTIRLSIYTRRREIEVMRLVGATRWFIRWPFMIEGVVVVGMLGGAIAILVLWIGKVTVGGFALGELHVPPDAGIDVLPRADGLPVRSSRAGVRDRFRTDAAPLPQGLTGSKTA